MIRRLLPRPVFVLAGLSAIFPVIAPSAPEAQQITLTEKLQIPGAVLKPGTYTFVVEDRLQDRTIVRITTQEGDKHYLLLTVPNRNLRAQPGRQGLALFGSPDGKREVLRGWACQGCSSPLEFVYPKLEAAKITSESAEAVLAVDPTSDKLPEKLSADDMKVVTLWLLSPKRITAENKGKGLNASKYNPANKASATAQTGEASPTAATTEIASAAAPSGSNASIDASSASGLAQPRRHLPKTASSTYSLALWGFLLVLAAALLRGMRTAGISK